jgi:hypothetical protein
MFVSGWKNKLQAAIASVTPSGTYVEIARASASRSGAKC